MQLKIDKKLSNNNCEVIVSVLDLEVGGYLEAIADFGETAVEFGGEVTATIPNPDESQKTSTPTIDISVTLPSRQVKLTKVAQAPIHQLFDNTVHKPNTQVIAEAWVTQIQKNVETMVNTLVAKVDTFSGESIVELPTVTA